MGLAIVFFSVVVFEFPQSVLIAFLTGIAVSLAIAVMELNYEVGELQTLVEHLLKKNKTKKFNHTRWGNRL